MNDILFSNELEKTILNQKKDFFYVNGDNVNSIVRNLRFVYHSVIASENLLLCAIQQLMLSEASSYRDTVLSYFTEHLEEERGHAEWLAKDLTTHGISISDLDNDAMAMVGSQYYMIHHRSPYCLLGYLAVAEGTPTPISEIEKLENVYGRMLFSFARFHSIKDEEHKIELFEVINKTPIRHRDDIRNSTKATLICISRAAKHWI